MDSKVSHLWVHIDDIVGGNLTLNEEKEPDFFNLDYEDVRLAGKIYISCALKKIGDSVFLDGEAKTEFEVLCARCANNFTMDASVELNGTFVKEVFEPNEEPYAFNETEADTYFYGSNKLDMFPMLRDALMLCMPMKPLCDEACQGLCSECGANLNNKNCGCKQNFNDFRLEELKKIKDKL